MRLFSMFSNLALGLGLPKVPKACVEWVAPELRPDGETAGGPELPQGNEASCALVEQNMDG